MREIAGYLQGGSEDCRRSPVTLSMKEQTGDHQLALSAKTISSFWPSEIPGPDDVAHFCIYSLTYYHHLR